MASLISNGVKIPVNKEWTLIETEDYANYLFVFECWEGYTHLAPQWGFVNARFLGAEYNNGPCNLFILKESHDRLNKIHFDYLFNKAKVWDKLHAVTVKNSVLLFNLAKKIKSLKPEKLSDRDLLRWLLKFQSAQNLAHTPRGPMWLLETPRNIVSDYLLNYLKEKSEEIKNLKIQPNEAFRIMITPLQKSILIKEKEELAKVGLTKNTKERTKKLALHAGKYEWLEYGLQGKILDLNYFKEEFNKLKKYGFNKTLREVSGEIKEIRKTQEQVAKLYNIGKVHKKIFKIVADSMQTRAYSKFAQFYAYYCLEGMLREIGRRGDLTIEQVRFLTRLDYGKILFKHKNFNETVNQRIKHGAHFSDKGKTVFFHGQAADRIMKKIKFYQIEKKSDKSKAISGQPAYTGVASGRVKIINTRQEMAKMHQGNILVSHMTNPDIVPAMKMAAAIITDLGGITCHAAIVARELKKPCVIGTRIATKVLHDGDMVEVDANKGIIKKIK